MVPTTFLAGMTLPLFTHVLMRGREGEKAIGRVYSANTLGAIVGVLFAVHIGMPLRITSYNVCYTKLLRIYEYGRTAMEAGDFRDALLYFQALQARFPFANATRQAQLDMIYAFYRNRERVV